MSPITERRLPLGLPAALGLGLVMFLVFAGPGVLDPTNIGWLDFGDRATHTAGWWFFAQSPWGLPPGANPADGLELSSGVAMSDSLPLVAIPLKLIAPWLPAHFQYWGFWLLACFLLQAFFAHRIAEALDLPTVARLVAVAFCVMMPAFLYRLTVHMALAGHWLVLWAIYLHLRKPSPSRLAWPLLVVISAAVHAYLLAIVASLWLASLAQRLWLRRLGPIGAAGELVLGFGAALVVLWATGSFMVGSLGSTGYGYFRANLVTFLDSDGWSFFWPDLPEGPGDVEGFAYLGIGVLVLCVPAALALRDGLPRLASPRFLPLVVVSLGLTLFALSNRIGIASANLPAIPLPGPLQALGDIFRASGRMIWPAAYLMVFAVVLLADRTLRRRMPATATLFLAVLVYAQAADSASGWAQFRAGPAMIARSWPTPVSAPFWAVAAGHYAKLRGIPVVAHNESWDLFAPFLLAHHMSTDMIYLARVDANALANLRARAAQAVARAEFDRDSLYILDEATARTVFPRLAPADALARVDGFIVLAPGGAGWAYAPGLGAIPYAPGPTPLAAGETIQCGHHGKCRPYLAAGWDNERLTESWTTGKSAELAFSLAAPTGPATLKLEGMGLPPSGASAQTVTVALDGAPIGTLAASLETQTYEIALPQGLAAGPHRLTFAIAAPVSPFSLGLGNETATLGFGMSSFAIEAGR